MCSAVKPRIRELAGKQERLVGLRAVEILLALYDSNDPGRQHVFGPVLLFLTIVLDRLDFRHAHVRANLTGALVHLISGRHDSADGHGRGIGLGQQQLQRLFGLGERRSSGRFERDLTMTSFVSDATELNVHQINLIGELKNVVQKGNARERAAATLTLLKLCGSGSISLMNQTQTHVSSAMIIRCHLLSIKLLDVFVGQLRHKDCALLAAYALATCLKHSEWDRLR